MAARRGSLALFLALAGLLAYLSSPGAGFAGHAAAPKAKSRTALRARAMDILVTVDQTGMRTRLNVVPDMTIGEMKKKAINSYGFDYAWMKESQWVISKLDGSKSDCMDDSKTAGDYGLSNYDEVLMFFTP